MKNETKRERNRRKAIEARGLTPLVEKAEELLKEAKEEQEDIEEFVEDLEELIEDAKDEEDHAEEDTKVWRSFDDESSS
jgi:transcription elongation GreA/GreB family factor